MQKTKGHKILLEWLKLKNWKLAAFQKETIDAFLSGKSGLVNAPTGCGKTFSVFLGSIIQYIDQHPNNYQTNNKNGLQL